MAEPACKSSSLDTEKETLLPVDIESRTPECLQITKLQRNLLVKEIVLLCSVFINLVLLFVIIAKKPSIQQCVKSISAYSPLLNRYQVTLSPRLSLNSSLEPSLTPSVYRQSPSPEVDAAWSRVTSTHLFPLRREEVVKMGKDPDFVVRMPKEFGFGDDLHAGFMDVFHKIHCLDVLRREAHSDYYGASSKSPLGQAHLDHCIQILLEGLMCKPNLQIIPYIWLEGHPTPTPDFINTDVCWDFEDVISWKETHGHLNDRSYYDLYSELRPKTKETPTSEGWKKLVRDEAAWKAKNSNADLHH